MNTVSLYSINLNYSKLFEPLFGETSLLSLTCEVLQSCRSGSCLCGCCMHLTPFEEHDQQKRCFCVQSSFDSWMFSVVDSFMCKNGSLACFVSLINVHDELEEKVSFEFEHFPCSEAHVSLTSHCSPLIFFLSPSLEWNPFPSPTEESHVLGQPGEGLCCFSLSLSHGLISLLLYFYCSTDQARAFSLFSALSASAAVLCSVECRWCLLK